jgi:hypothetical protein
MDSIEQCEYQTFHRAPTPERACVHNIYIYINPYNFQRSNIHILMYNYIRALVFTVHQSSTHRLPSRLSARKQIPEKINVIIKYTHTHKHTHTHTYIQLGH